MSKSLFRALLVLLCLPLVACGGARLSPQQDADLRAVYEKERVNDLAGLEAAFEPQFRTPQLRQSLAFMQGMIPPAAPTVRLLKPAIEKDAQGRTNYGGIYEYDYPSTAVLAEIEMRQDAAGRKTIVAFHMRQADRGIVDHFAFGLMGKKPYQYAFLVLALMSPGLGLWGLVMLWRAPDIRWKVLWAVAMLLGFMDLTMDWASGDVVLNLYKIHIAWVSATQFSPLSPWMISTSLPLAAIAFLLGYRRLDRPWDGPKPPKPPKPAKKPRR